MPGTKDPEGETVADRLAQLPPSEHAILLNRFKFLSLVQRVAAADVAEMINTVGLEALTYKTALEHLPAPLPKARGKSARRGRSPSGPDTLSRARRPTRRFYNRDAEQEFIERMARPGRRDEAAAFNALGHKAMRETAKGPPPRKSGENEWSVNGGGDAGEDDDAVVIDSFSEDQQPPAVMAAAASKEVSLDSPDYTRLKQEQQQHRHRPPVPTPSPTLRRENKNADDSLHVKDPHVNPRLEESQPDALNSPLESYERYGVGSPISPPSKVAEKAPAPNQISPSMLSNSNFRSRGHFAPKAKPKAATDTPRVPLEVIRHASALIARSGAAAAANRHLMRDVHPPSNSGVFPATTGDSVEGNPFNQNESRTQSQLQDTGGTLRSAQWSKDDDVLYSSHASQGERGPKGGVMHNEDLTELTSCIERMLQDHRAILDGIVKEDPLNSAERTPPSHSMTPIAPARRETMAYTGEASRLLNFAPGALEDLSDEEDELLLINRLGRSVGAMDREMEAIARDEHLSGEDKCSDQDLNGDEKKVVNGGLITAKRRTTCDQRVALHDPKGDAVAHVRTKRGRRGEMPTAIVERLRSFQKDNHDYIRYAEKLWNNSHVTEQVFAQRLTESLLNDAFCEVFGEVSTILDEYVEGLAEHELQ